MDARLHLDRAWRRTKAQEARLATERRRLYAAVLAAREAGMSHADVAAVLGVTKSRAQALAEAAAAKAHDLDR